MASFASSSSSSSSLLRYFLHGTVGPSSGDPPFQFLEVRLGMISTEAPFSAPMAMANAVFPLSLRRFFHHRPPFHYLLWILSSLDLPPAASHAVARNIAAFVTHLTRGNAEVDLRVVAVVDYIQIAVSVGQRQRQSRSWNADESMILDEVPAPEPAPEFVEEEGGGELGDCSICFEELKIDGHGGNGSGTKKNKVVKIGCGHVYHKSCIITWLTNKNSCPLCRMPITLKF
ncbi:uncharacterized protein LOC111019546 [Momordica charantia]|uniref:Uncharacterized protein LOC111019546 n=1 Tax=Momordica charantia TaxID=3673 RepID=A0A6J1DDM9_MOMCH|nr:uncharacterized protein LOC111019546 [Momordica charantia]